MQKLISKVSGRRSHASDLSQEAMALIPEEANAEADFSGISLISKVSGRRSHASNLSQEAMALIPEEGSAEADFSGIRPQEPC
jgi:hypothetical protein